VDGKDFYGYLFGKKIKKNRRPAKGRPAVIQTASKPENVITFFMYSAHHNGMLDYK